MHAGLQTCLRGTIYSLTLELALSVDFFAPFQENSPNIEKEELLKRASLKPAISEILIDIFLELEILIENKRGLMIHQEIGDLVFKSSYNSISDNLRNEKELVTKLRKSIVMGNHLFEKNLALPDDQEGPEKWAKIQINAGTFLSEIAKNGGEKLSQFFDFRDFKEVIDVGGNDGSFLIPILKKNKNLVGHSIDLPKLKDRLEQQARENQLEKRLHLLGINIFEEAFPKSKLYLCGYLLHDFKKEAGTHILKNIYEALLPGGTFILHENLLDHPDRDVRFPLLLDQLGFLLQFGEHGHYRTSADYREWLEGIGFKWVKTEFNTPKSFMIFTK